MPWMDEGSVRTGERSFAGLVKSGGTAPHVQWVIDPSLPGLFEYSFANWPRSQVVIAKGTIISVGPHVRDYRTLAYRNIVTIADGTEDKPPVGVAPYNFMRRFDENGNIMHGFFEADDQVPGVITRDVVSVPYVPNPSDAALVHWGLATNHAHEFGTDGELKAGDYVKPNAQGKFVKWHWNKPVQESFDVTTDGSGEVTVQMQEPIYARGDVNVYTVGSADGLPRDVSGIAGVTVEIAHASGSVTIKGLDANTDYTLLVEYSSVISDPIGLRVGQVLEMLTDVPPEGWLKWVTPEVEPRGDLRREHTPVSPGNWEGGYGYDPNYKWPLNPNHESPGAWKGYAAIPGLTDGAVMGQTVRLENFVYKANQSSQMFALNPIARIDESTVKVTLIAYDGTETVVPAFEQAKGGWVLDQSKDKTGRPANKITLTTGSDFSAPASDTRVRVEYKIADAVGIPSGWDIAGAVGAVSILLQK